MKTIGFVALVLFVVCPVTVGLQPDKGEKKVVTLKGTILCAKCALKEAKKCQTAIQVKEGEKLVTYYFDDKGSAESYHEAVCGADGKEGTVTGNVTEKDGKKWIKPTKVEYSKK